MRLAAATMLGLSMLAAACNALVGNEDGVYRPELDAAAGPKEAGGGGEGGGIDGGGIDGGVVTPPGLQVVAVTRTNRIFTDGKHVYFPDDGARKIRRVPVSSVAAEDVVASTGADVSDLVSDGTKIYWSSSSCPGAIRACIAIPCSSSIAIAANESAPSRLALDAFTLHWSNSVAAGSCGDRAGALVRMSVVDGTTTILQQPGAGVRITGVARVGLKTAWIEQLDSSAKIRACDADNCSPVYTIATDQTDPVRLTAASDSVFWATSDGKIMKASFLQNTAQLWARAPGVRDLAFDDSFVYWTTYDPATRVGAVSRCSRTTSCAAGGADVIANPASPSALAVTSGAVWFISLVALGVNTDSALYRLTKN